MLIPGKKRFFRFVNFANFFFFSIIFRFKDIFEQQGSLMEHNQAEENLSLSVGPPASISSVE